MLGDGTADRKVRPPRRRIRVPRLHGETLQLPPLDEAERCLKNNLQNLDSSSNVSIGSMSRIELSRLGRREVVELARKHTQTYRDTGGIIGDELRLDRIVMSGHQPTLFHPGVWYKNFALSKLGSNLGCTTINLIVDNDICGVSAIKVPFDDGNGVSSRMLPLDAPGDNIPFEAKRIVDRDFFDSFGLRAKTAIGQFVTDPIVEPLWAIAKGLHQFENRLGDTVAASRHALEIDLGLRTLEVPVSHLSQTMAFAHFAHHLLDRAEGFRSIHNRALMEYRALNRIRSNSHPVPPLETEGEWTEAPFWIWKTDQPVRTRLFSKFANGKTHLTNRRNIQLSLDNVNFVEAFSELTSLGIVIRPRALATTMFSRILLSDLFLHGIGGAKYDQLTDAIIGGFFGINPPEFMTLTATMKLPIQHENVTTHDMTGIEQKLRDLTYHPEAHISRPSREVIELASRKREWILTEIPGGNRRRRHHGIEECNRQLHRFVEDQRRSFEQQRLDLAVKLERSRILGSREYSFCLFPLELADQLAALAR